MIWFPYTLIHLDMNSVLTAATNVLKLSFVYRLLYILSIYCIQFCRTGDSGGCSALWAVTHNYAHYCQGISVLFSETLSVDQQNPLTIMRSARLVILTNNKTLYVTELLNGGREGSVDPQSHQTTEWK